MNELFIFYIIISFLTLFSVAKLSYKYNFLDNPTKRKTHLKPTPHTGGIAIAMIYIFSIYLLDNTSNLLNIILSIGFLISIIGFIDDISEMSPGSKLALQCIPIFYLMVFETLVLNDIGNYGILSIELGAFKIPFTLVCVLFLVNSFNYFDGLDGSLSASVISIIGILYFLTSDLNIHLYLATLLIPIIIFIFFNFSYLKLPKMFLGDSGSLCLGFIFSFLLIYLANKNIAHPILLAWSVVIFVYEFLSINLIRLKNKKDPFKAGKDHLHHVLFQKTKSLFLTNSYIALINIILFIIGYLSFTLINPLTSLIIFVLIFFIFLILRNQYSKNSKIW